MLYAVSVFDQISSEDMAEEQPKDPILGLICPYVTAGKKLKTLPISDISKDVRKYLLLFTD